MDATPEPRYVGWCRPRGGRWERVAGTESFSFGRCYTVLMELAELRGGAPDGQEYRILEIGQYPRDPRT